MSAKGKGDRDAVAPPLEEAGQQTKSVSREQLSSGASEVERDLQSDSLPAEPGQATGAARGPTRPEHHGTNVPPRVRVRPHEDLQSPQGFRPPDPTPPMPRPVPQPHQRTVAASAYPRTAEATSRELAGDELRAARLIAERKIPSANGWRKALRVATFGAVKLGLSPDERRVRDLHATVDSPPRGTHSVVVLGGKGGTGKTTIAIGVGSTFAVLHHKVVAIDGNPDLGANLGERIDPTATSSYREMLADNRLERYADVRSHVGQSPTSALDVLAANRHVSDRKLLDAKTYLAAHERLQRFYSVLVTDSGTNVEHPVVKGLLENANSIILVSSCTPDSVQAAAKVMDWLQQSRYSELLARSVVVLNDVTGRADRKMIDTLVDAFSRRMFGNRVFVLPYDPHIAAASDIDVNQLRRATRRRFLEITAAVAANFPATPDTPSPPPAA
jgi:MinD-like ATPase involved in chromosome partitioning or flagellar assembly